MYEAEVAVCGFVVADCETAGIFELVEAALYHVTKSIDGGIDRQLDQPVSLGWDHRDTAAPRHVYASVRSMNQ